MTNEYEDENEILAVVNGFEQCTTGKDSFSHRSHLTVGAFYLQTLAPEQAFEKMRTGLLRFLNFHEVESSVYSDEITRAWMDEIQKVISDISTPSSLVKTTNAVVTRLAEKTLRQNENG